METIEKGIVLGSKGKLECVLVKEVLEVIDKVFEDKTQYYGSIADYIDELKARINGK